MQAFEVIAFAFESRRRRGSRDRWKIVDEDRILFLSLSFAELYSVFFD